MPNCKQSTFWQKVTYWQLQTIHMLPKVKRKLEQLECLHSENTPAAHCINTFWPSDIIWVTIGSVNGCLVLSGNVDLSSVGSCGIYLSTLSQVLMKLILNMFSKITVLKILTHLPGANELNSKVPQDFYDMFNTAQGHHYIKLFPIYIWWTVKVKIWESYCPSCKMLCCQ